MSMSAESSAEIERDAETERAELVSTLGQLRENLKPANIIHEVMAGAQINVTDITNRTWQTARANPMPAALIGLGAARLLGVGQTIRVHKAHGPKPQAAGTTSGLKTPVRESLSPSSRNDGMSRHYLRSRDRVTNPITKLVDEQPLVLAALGLAVGAAIGAAIPSSETEAHLMGDASGSVKHAAREVALEQYSHLKETAAPSIDEAKRTAFGRGLSSENRAGLVRRAEPEFGAR